MSKEPFFMPPKRQIKIAAWVLFGLVVLFLYGSWIIISRIGYSNESTVRNAAVEIAFGLRNLNSHDYSLKSVAKAPEAVRQFCDPRFEDICSIARDFPVDPCKPIFPFSPQRCVTLYVSPQLLMDAQAFETLRRAALYPCTVLPNRETFESWTRPTDPYMKPARALWEDGRCDKGGDWVTKVYLKIKINGMDFDAAWPLERE